MKKKLPVAKNPLILRFHRLVDAFAKSDDERDFYLDSVEGFILFADLDKSEEDLDNLEREMLATPGRYHLVPKMTFYETKKFMEGFVNEKVYDIDTKEKLLDIIGAKEARENFLEFIYDHLTEMEKWQQYYHERSRVRVIEWLRDLDIHFVFEEDLEIARPTLEKVKQHLFDGKVTKDVTTARAQIETKSKTYYSNEALNPRPKRGRPPKQVAKVEVEPQLTSDFYTTVPTSLRPLLFLTEYTTSAASFSSKFVTEAQFLANMRGTTRVKVDTKLEALSQRLESLRTLSSKLQGVEDLSLGKEEGLLHAFKAPEEEEDKPKGRISQLAGGFLPKGGKKKSSIKDLAEKRKEKGMKSVTPIKRKKGDD